MPGRGLAELQQRQARGELRVRLARDYRRLVRQRGLAAAYASTDVVVAGDAGFTDQATLQLGLGPCDPPIRIRQFELDGVSGLGSSGSGDLLLPIGGGLVPPLRRGGAQLLAALLAGERLPLLAVGEATALHPRRELEGDLELADLGTARLLLQRAVVENGVVGVNSSPGLCPSPLGPLLGPWGSALYSCNGADSIGLTMPRLWALGPGSPLLVAGAIGWVVGTGSGHQPQVERLASGHARSPGAAAAVSVDLHGLSSEWIRPCWFEGHGSALLVAIAAPIPLIHETAARQAAAGDGALEAPVLDLSLPRRVKPCCGWARYDALLSGQLELEGHSLRCAPAHSPRLAASIAAELVRLLEQNRFPLQLPLQGLGERSGLIPFDGER